MGKKRGETSDKLILKQALKKKVNYLLRKPKIEPSEAYNLIKEFFKIFTGHEYEYTREELIEELHKIYLEENEKKEIEDIILKLGKIEFYEVDFTQQEIRDMLQKFAATSDKLVHVDKVQNHNFWEEVAGKFSHKLHREENKKKSEEPSLLQRFVEEADRESLGASQEPEQTQEPEQMQEESVPAEEMEVTVPYNEENIVEPEKESVPEQTSALDSFHREPVKSEDLTHFETALESFYNNLAHRKHDIARLEYEELSYHYSKLSDELKKLSYDRMRKAHSDLVQSLN